MPRVLEVPLLEADSFLTIDVDADLSEDPSEICQLLAAEESATKWWLAIASAYSAKGDLRAAVDVLETGLRESKLLKTDADRAPFWAQLSWLHIARLRASPADAKQPAFEAALEAANRSLEAFQNTLDPRDAQQRSVPAVLAQAALVAAVGNVNDSLAPFQTVLAAQPENVVAKLGRARVLYSRQNYRGALRLYQEVLRQTARSTTEWSFDARLGVGLCFWWLQDRVKARLSWERVIAVAVAGEATAAGAAAVGRAHAMLGVWHLDAALNGVRSEFETHYRASMDQFQRAYRLGETARPALGLAGYLFSRHDMVRVAQLTDRVLAQSSMSDALAEALFWKARAAHYAKDLATAHALYTQALGVDDKNVAAALGKGLVEVLDGRNDDALLTFEQTAQRFPKNVDALFYAGVFGALHLQNHSSDPVPATRAPDVAGARPREMLEQYLVLSRAASRPPRPEALVLLSELLEKTNPPKAYELLTTAVTQLKAAAGEADAYAAVPLPILINLGVLAFNMRRYADAVAVFRTAHERVTAGDAATANGADAAAGTENVAEFRNTVEYNLARSLETAGEAADARAIYMELPTVDSQARLVLLDLAEAAGDTGSSAAEAGETAVAAMQRLVDASPERLELRALHAWLLGATGRRPEAAEVMKHTLSGIDKHDAYALVAIGNTYLANAQSQPRSDAPRRQRAFVRAAEFFEKALQLDTHNAYAAHGIAIALAETRRADLAVPLLERVRESLRGTSPDVLINAGHALMDAADFAKATEAYEQALAVLPRDDDDAKDAAGATAGAAAGAEIADSADAVSAGILRPALVALRGRLLTLLARAWLARGSRRKEVDSLGRSVDYAEQAVAFALRHPDSSASSASTSEASPSVAEYNLAFAQLTFADVVLRRAPSQRTLEQLERARSGTAAAAATLQRISDAEGSGSVPYSAADLEERLDHAENTLLPRLAQAASEQSTSEARAVEKREESKRAMEEARRVRAEEQQKQRDEQLKREQQLADERRRLQEEAAQWEAERETERQAAAQAGAESPPPGKAKTKSKGRKGRGRRGNDDDLIDDSEMPPLPDTDESDGDPDAGDGSDHEGGRETRDADEDEDYDKVERKKAVMDDSEDEEPSGAKEGAEEKDLDDLF